MNNNQDIIDYFFHRSFENTWNEKILDDIDFVVPKDKMYEYVKNLLGVPYQEYLYYLIGVDLPVYTTDEITQMSKFSAAEVEMCRALLDHDNLSYTFDEIGQMFPEYCKTSTSHAYKKYGENQVKTAKQLGLTYLYYGKWYLNCIGYIYLELTVEERKSLLARTILRDPFLGTIVRDMIFDDCILNAYMLDLSASTMKRRAGGILSIIKLAIDEATKSGFELGKCTFSKADTKLQKSAKPNTVAIHDFELFYMFNKRVDKSFLNSGFTVAKKAHSLIPHLLDSDLERGTSKMIYVCFDGRYYLAKINNVKFSNSDRVCVQITWLKSSGAIEHIKEYCSNNNIKEVMVIGVLGKGVVIIKPSINNIEDEKIIK